MFQVEYQVGAGTVCPAANGANRNAILESIDLFDVPWRPAADGARAGLGIHRRDLLGTSQSS